MRKMFLSLICLGLALSACEAEKAKSDAAETAKNAAAAAPAVVAQAAAVAKVEPAPAPVVKEAQMQTIDWKKAEELAAAGGLFVDVRNPDELQAGFVPNAVNIPLGELHHRLNELPKDKDLLVYCRSGRRSEAASNVLLSNGFEKVYNVAGGFLAYPKK